MNYLTNSFQMRLNLSYTLLLTWLLLFSFSGAVSQVYPAEELDSLFIDVQLNRVFSDQKKFPDCIPKYPVAGILKKYRSEKHRPGFVLKNFVAENFDTTLKDTSLILRHIDNLWEYLTRGPDTTASVSSLIPLPYPYIVPGGRFREVYYWDSYFTMLGLAESGKYETIRDMIDNFCYLIDRYGHIPNGNRTYYLSRSQPPFFSLMIELLADKKGDSVYRYYLPYLEKEYLFWMGRDQAFATRLVKPDKNDKLNRYYDALSTPRPESYIMDIDIYKRSARDSMIFRNIRATAESGWDFSSRWLKGDTSLTKISTTQIIPVDLNCLLYHLELTLSRCYALKNVHDMSASYKALAGYRKNLINKYFWNEEKGFYFDYNLTDKVQSGSYTLAGVFPLFFELANNDQADRVALVIKEKFLCDGGVVTTLVNSGQQWDYPNGWAPLQWMTYKGLKNYGKTDLANTIARRWLDLNTKVFFDTGKMMEKYNVVDTGIPGGGGEYQLQDGFGWTNGVFLRLWDELKRESKGR